jgi:hypothetical protein
MLTTISAQYLLAEKQGKNPVDALKRALLAIGQDRGHILSKLYTDYAQRSNAFMTGVPIWKNASTVDSATIIIRKKDGTVDTTMVYRSAVQRLCESMASILGDSSYCFEKRVAMREAVATTQSVFGQELTQLALQEEESEDDA